MDKASRGDGQVAVTAFTKNRQACAHGLDNGFVLHSMAAIAR